MGSIYGYGTYGSNGLKQKVFKVAVEDLFTKNSLRDRTAGMSGKIDHLPVMAQEVLRHLNVRPGGVYVDGTIGGGGHTLEILGSSRPDGRVIGIDRDDEAIREAKSRLRPFAGRVVFARDNFRNIKKVLKEKGISGVDGVVLDLGVSSFHLESPERGFSFRFDTRLDMRMDRAQEATAYDLINDLEVQELVRIFRSYGEERHSVRIAKAIDKVRAVKPIETTGELARVILDTVPRRFHKGAIHPATRVFQALRIAVNDELESLKKGLADGIDVLNKGGRMVVISFHSLEDRIVKTEFRQQARGCICPPRIPRCVCGIEPKVRLITKRAVVPSKEEVEKNPRSRSAKLRAIEKI